MSARVLRDGDVWVTDLHGPFTLRRAGPGAFQGSLPMFRAEWPGGLVSTVAFSTEDEIRDLWPGDWVDATPAEVPAPEFSAPVARVLRYFRYEHLPAPLQAVSRPFAELADLVARSSSNPETTVALRKLLEAKDAAVRAVLP